jgi:hypothetical protein
VSVLMDVGAPPDQGAAAMERDEGEEQRREQEASKRGRGRSRSRSRSRSRPATVARRTVPDFVDPDLPLAPAPSPEPSQLRALRQSPGADPQQRPLPPMRDLGPAGLLRVVELDRARPSYQAMAAWLLVLALVHLPLLVLLSLPWRGGSEAEAAVRWVR